MTSRLYYQDSYLRSFRAAVVETADDGRRVYLDQTAFYPSSGGQPFDTGQIGASRVMDVLDEEEQDRIAHVVETPLVAGSYDCAVDWPRRWDHMQQHTGQHLLSAVLLDLFNAPTVSFHLGQLSSTIDIETRNLAPEQIDQAVERANQIVCESRSVTVSYHEATQDVRLRKPSERAGTLRVVSIQDLDRSACGGTHVRSTGEIGAILIRSIDKVRGHVRVEFLCGGRAIRRARADYEALSRIARHFSAPSDQVPALVAQQGERLAEADKLRRKLAFELAQVRGRELHASTTPNAAGLRVHVGRLEKGPMSDEVRAEAQAFAGAGNAVYVVACAEPASVLVAVSQPGPFAAGATLKPLLEQHGGRGGGNAQLAQGSLPSREAADLVVCELTGRPVPA